MKRIFAAAAAFMIMPAVGLPAAPAFAGGTAGAPSVGVSAAQAQVDTEPSSGPTILSPATGSNVAGDFSIRGQLGDAVHPQLWIGGTSVDFSRAVIDLTAGTYGISHRLAATTGGRSLLIQVGDCAAEHCSSPLDGTVTDSITVIAFPALGLDITSPSTAYLSPNGDGRQESVTVRYTTTVPGRVNAVVRRAGGMPDGVVRDLDLGDRPAGSAAFVWNGKDAHGTLVPNGQYVVMLSVLPSGNEEAMADLVMAFVDTQAPALSGLKRSLGTVFPKKDTFRDAVTFSAKVSEATALGQVRVTNAAGKTVRTLSASSRPAGDVKLTWDGRYASGKIVAAGTYAFRWTVRDLAGNNRVSVAGSVKVDRRAYSRRVASRTVTPAEVYGGYWVGDCSRLAKNPNGWAGGHGYYSMWRKQHGQSCPDVLDNDFVFGEYRLTIPKAAQYGSVKVGVTGKSHSGDSTATVVLVRFSDDCVGCALTAATRTLQPAYGTYWTTSYPLGKLGDGRIVSWRVLASNYAQYDVRAFKVTWSYYVPVT